MDRADHRSAGLHHASCGSKSVLQVGESATLAYPHALTVDRHRPRNHQIDGLHLVHVHRTAHPERTGDGGRFCWYDLGATRVQFDEHPLVLEPGDGHVQQFALLQGPLTQRTLRLVGIAFDGAGGLPFRQLGRQLGRRFAADEVGYLVVNRFPSDDARRFQRGPNRFAYRPLVTHGASVPVCLSQLVCGKVTANWLGL